MASLIIDKKASGEYLRIVEAYRDQTGRKRMRTLFNLGRRDSYSPESLRRIGERLYQLGGGDLKDLVGEHATEEGRFNYGFPQVCSKLLVYYSLDIVLDRITKRKKLSYELRDIVLLLLAERFNDPCSKLASYRHQGDYFNLPKASLQHIYRCLDHLANHSKLIQQTIFNTGRDLFNSQLDVVFYDVTTFYFDSDKQKEGALRQKGFSKDGKIGKTQVVFGMLIDQQKQPVGYQLYQGSQYEGHTYKDMVDRLKKEYQIERIILVADRGMLNLENLSKTQQAGYEFIVGERLRSLPKDKQDELLNKDNYKLEWTTPGSSEQDPHVIKYTSIAYKNRRIVCTYSEKRAKKDSFEREKRLEKAKQLLKNPSGLKKKAAHYFLKSVDKDEYQLDEAKIEENKRYDGYLAITYQAEGITELQALEQYHQLYQIEHSFRTFKSYLETRPMFHWTDKRIQGHICLCYIAYGLLNQLQLRLKEKGTPMSENEIRETLDKMQVSLIQQGDNQFYMRSKLTESAQHILKAIGDKPPADLFAK